MLKGDHSMMPATAAFPAVRLHLADLEASLLCTAVSRLRAAYPHALRAAYQHTPQGILANSAGAGRPKPPSSGGRAAAQAPQKKQRQEEKQEEQEAQKGSQAQKGAQKGVQEASQAPPQRQQRLFTLFQQQQLGQLQQQR
jgi:hypothetical protein